ncbi:Pentatricopeptide repeat-containing protein [Quillaja saponaria]|uniref:Pentatricopeptide repeat-containing protein n=1 Tax=Quillaja saponaria TaxID=32244 RepID=A0AAD7KYY6_QUISA|nr:Pentatricopeptide repeat-containing protein [Quillaja saponaria]
MILIRAKTVAQIKAISLHLRHKHTQSRPFPSRYAKRVRTIPLHERAHTPTPKLRKKIPFVDEVKEVYDPEEALSLFQEYKEMGFKHDYPSYSALLYKLAHSRNFGAVETVLDHIQNRNIYCRETIFVALIQHYGKAQLPVKAIELFHRMRQFNCVRTLQSFNALLNTLVDSDLFSDANEIFERSYKTGFRPNSVSFNIIIKGWLVKERVIWIKQCPMLEDMTQKRKYPNEVTYALLMEGLCSVGKYVEAKKMMFDMAYRGCKPRLVNFGVLMSHLGKTGKIEEAKSLLHEMKKRRFKPDVVIYNILINYLCKESRVSEAYKIWTEMQVSGCAPNAATYRMMVDGFCRVDDFERGLSVLNAMLTSRHYPRSETFNCLVVGLLNSGKIDFACFVLEEMEKRKMQFNLEGWETLVRYACGENRDATGLVTELTSIPWLH